MQRRNFLLAAGGLLGGPAVARASELAALPPTPTTLRLAGFRQLVGQEFMAYQGKRGAQLELVAVRAGKALPHQEQFTLVFAGPPGLAPRAGPPVPVRPPQGRRPAARIPPSQSRRRA